MKVLLVRVGVDGSAAGGRCNAPVDPTTREFVYLGIPETQPVLPGYEHPYTSEPLLAALGRLGATLPAHLRTRHMHLDPDFEHNWIRRYELCLPIGRFRERACWVC